MNRPLLILTAGPYRSGADGDRAATAADLRRHHDASALPRRVGTAPASAR